MVCTYFGFIYKCHARETCYWILHKLTRGRQDNCKHRQSNCFRTLPTTYRSLIEIMTARLLSREINLAREYLHELTIGGRYYNVAQRLRRIFGIKYGLESILCHWPTLAEALPRTIALKFFIFSFRVSSRDKRIYTIDRDRATSRVVTNTATKLFAFTSYRINTRSIQTCFFGRGLRSARYEWSLSRSLRLYSTVVEFCHHTEFTCINVVGNAAPEPRFLPLRCFPAFLRDMPPLPEIHRNVDTRRLSGTTLCLVDNHQSFDASDKTTQRHKLPTVFSCCLRSTYECNFFWIYFPTNC